MFQSSFSFNKTSQGNSINDQSIEALTAKKANLPIQELAHIVIILIKLVYAFFFDN